jgi:hypothetical protein
MSVKASLEVAGLKEVLREINQIDRSARFKITREFKKIGKPVVDEAKSQVPQTPPISGWGRSWTTSKSNYKMLPWDGAPAKQFIDVKVSGKRPKEYAGQIRDLAVVVIRWRGAVNTLFDLAHDFETPRGANMVRGLKGEFGKASRIMWPAYEKHANEVEKQIRDQVIEVMAQVNRRLDRTRL